MATWLPGVRGIEADSDTEFDAVFGLRPDLHEAYRDFADVFWTERLLDPVVLELCRLRCAQLLRCESELAVRTLAARDAGFTQADVDALANGTSDPRFSDAQRACLAVAQQFVLDPHGVTAAQRAAVVEHHGDAGLVALVEALAVFDGFMRFRTILGVDAAGRPLETG